MALILDGTNGINSSGVIVAPDGTSSAPSITNDGDTNTGIYFPAADTIGFAEGGVQVGEFDSSANFKFNSGYGSVATAYGCRAWVNFDGTTNVGGFCTIRASGNVSSVADNGTGNYTVNFTTAMPDANYITVGAGNNRMVASSSQTTSASTLNVRDGSGALSDVGQVNVAIFR